MVAYHTGWVVAEARDRAPTSAPIGALDVDYICAVGTEIAVIGPGHVERPVIGINCRAQYCEEAELVRTPDRAGGLLRCSHSRRRRPCYPTVGRLGHLHCADPAWAPVEHHEVIDGPVTGYDRICVFGVGGANLLPR